MSQEAWLLVLGLVIVLGIIASTAILPGIRRGLARELGLSYERKGDHRLLAKISTCEEYQVAVSGNVHNHFHGPLGPARFSLFEFRGRKEDPSLDLHPSTFIRQTFGVIECERLRVPSFRLRPGRGRRGAARGDGEMTPVDLGGATAFSRRYHLAGEDAAAVRRVFGASLVRYFEEHPRWIIDGDRERLVLRRSGWSPWQWVRPGGGIRWFVNEAREILALFLEASEDASPVGPP